MSRFLLSVLLLAAAAMLPATPGDQPEMAHGVEVNPVGYTVRAA